MWRWWSSGSRAGRRRPIASRCAGSRASAFDCRQRNAAAAESDQAQARADEAARVRFLQETPDADPANPQPGKDGGLVVPPRGAQATAEREPGFAAEALVRRRQLLVARVQRIELPDVVPLPGDRTVVPTGGERVCADQRIPESQLASQSPHLG